MAEVYWDLEGTMQQPDLIMRTISDCTIGCEINVHVRCASISGPDWITRTSWLDCVENHDEQRAAATFPANIHEAAAVTSTCPRGCVFSIKGSSRGEKNASHRISSEHPTRGKTRI